MGWGVWKFHLVAVFLNEGVVEREEGRRLSGDGLTMSETSTGQNE